jgi:hypothetical protein
MDLKAVQSVISAMRAADISAGGVPGPLGIITKPGPGPRLTYHPTPRFEPRPVHHPTPRFEPRFTVHPQPRIEEQPTAPAPEPETPRKVESAIQPPWRVRLWETPVQPPPKVKQIIHRSDVISKGSLIDLFI